MTGMPSRRSASPVPPVETISHLRATNSLANWTMPRLSETDSRALIGRSSYNCGGQKTTAAVGRSRNNGGGQKAKTAVKRAMRRSRGKCGGQEANAAVKRQIRRSRGKCGGQEANAAVTDHPTAAVGS